MDVESNVCNENSPLNVHSPPSPGLEDPLVIDKDPDSDTYESVVDAGEKYLFGCFAMPSEDFATITVSLEIISFLSLLVSVYSDKTEEKGLSINIITYSWYFILICWVWVPLWQNYTIRENETKADFVFGDGFVCCRSIAVLWGLLCGQAYSLVPREDGPGRSTRFLPFSLYNYWFMAVHPGKQLNSELPWRTKERFGFSRSFLLVISTNALGTLNSYIFVYAFYQLFNESSGPVSTVSALVSAVTALIGYQVTLLSIVYGWMLIPYSIGMYVAFFFYDLFDCTNPRRDTCVYGVLRSLWAHATAQS